MNLELDYFVRMNFNLLAVHYNCVVFVVSVDFCDQTSLHIDDAGVKTK